MICKNVIIFCLFFVTVSSFAQIETDSSDTFQNQLYHKDHKDKIFKDNEVDTIPRHKQYENIMTFIYKNIIYPKDNYSKGNVCLSFVVEKNGLISNTIIIKKLTESCDKESKRLVSILPGTWNPALKNGKPVRYQYIICIKFK